MFSDITFEYQHLLNLLFLIPLLILWYIWRNKELSTDIRFSDISFFEGYRKTLRQHLRHLPFILRIVVFLLLILALARPQSTSRTHDVELEGIDIMIALDISGSMLAEDFKPNRMEAAKKTALEFIDMRPNDRIGVTVFSGQSFTLCPLTTDHSLVKELTRTVYTGMVEDGTAIGDGLANAVNRLRESQSISKVIILLTDGINNTGMIDPLTAAEIAAMLDIRVYTIGVGSDGKVPYPFETPYGVQYRNVEIPVDQDLLEKIAEMTGGKYFWANKPHKLEAVYEEIDQLERTKIDVKEYKRKTDEFYGFVMFAIILFAVEAFLRYTVLKSLP